VAGAILADHLKSLDWRARCAEHAGRLPQDVLHDVLDRIAALLGY
jgi:mRNA interferase MazF